LEFLINFENKTLLIFLCVPRVSSGYEELTVGLLHLIHKWEQSCRSFEIFWNPYWLGPIRSKYGYGVYGLFWSFTNYNVDSNYYKTVFPFCVILDNFRYSFPKISREFSETLYPKIFADIKKFG